MLISGLSAILSDQSEDLTHIPKSRRATFSDYTGVVLLLLFLHLSISASSPRPCCGPSERTNTPSQSALLENLISERQGRVSHCLSVFNESSLIDNTVEGEEKLLSKQS